MMKQLTLFLLLATTMAVRAQVTHQFHNNPILEALQSINQEQSDYSSTFSPTGSTTSAHLPKS